MALTTTRYEADTGTVHPIRIGDDIVAIAANTLPAGAVAEGTPSVKVSKNIREFGVEPRHVLVYRVVGTAPDTARKYKVVPIFDPAQFSNAAFNPEAVLTIGGTAWIVLERKDERSK